MQNVTSKWSFSLKDYPQPSNTVNPLTSNTNNNNNPNTSASIAAEPRTNPPTKFNMNLAMNPISNPNINVPATGGMMSYASSNTSQILKNMSKSFEDDHLFCPQSLLSKEELSQRSQLDMLYAGSMSIAPNPNQQQQQQQSQSQAQQVQQPQQAHPNQQTQQRSRFNPYTSQSFNPGAV